MVKTGLKTCVVEAPREGDRIPPPDEVQGVPKYSDTVECIPVAERLLRVLVADDNKDAADSLAMLVRIWGHEVLCAYDGASALEMASTGAPDVLLLDVAMRGMDGCRLARHVRGRADLKDALLIAVTGFADEAHQLRCMEAGFDQFLAKPVAPSVVETLLSLERHRLAEARGAALEARREYGVLVVDDELGVRMVLDLWLRKEGFVLWMAANGREGLNLYERHRASIDVVLLDVRMPGLDGPRTLAALQRLNSRVRCCFMRGNLEDYTEAGLRDLGAAAVLPKPFRLEEVTRTLRELATRGGERASAL